jgi:hypothetical protein
LECHEHTVHFYGNATDIYTKVLERTAVYEKSVKAFHGVDEYVAILYKVATQSPVSPTISLMDN